jgi:hypothetical protein
MSSTTECLICNEDSHMKTECCNQLYCFDCWFNNFETNDYNTNCPFCRREWCKLYNTNTNDKKKKSKKHN